MAVIELVSAVDVSRREVICRGIDPKYQAQLEERGSCVAFAYVNKALLAAMGKNNYRTLEENFEYFSNAA